MNIKNILKKLFSPSNKVIILSIMAAVPLTILTLVFLSENNPVSYGVFMFSTYTLVIAVVGAARLIMHIKMLAKQDRIRAVVFIKKIMRKNRYTGLYLDSREYRAKVSLYTGLAFNMAYAVFNGVVGAYYDSPWQWSMGIYYLFLGNIRYMLMKKERGEGSDTDSRAVYEYRTYRLCGLMILILDLSIGGMAVQMIFHNRANIYSQTVMIISAAYTFFYFFRSVYNVVSFRKRNNIILSAAKNVSLAGASMSMLFLQTSMLNTFGTKGMDDMCRYLNLFTGTAVTVFVMIVAVYMMIHSSKMICRLRESDHHSE